MRNVLLAILCAIARLGATDAYVDITDPYGYTGLITRGIATVSGTAGGSELTGLRWTLQRAHGLLDDWLSYDWATGTWSATAAPLVHGPEATWTIALPPQDDNVRYELDVDALVGATVAWHKHLSIWIDRVAPTVVITGPPPAIDVAAQPVTATAVAADVGYGGVAMVWVELMRSNGPLLLPSWWNWTAGRWDAVYDEAADRQRIGYTPPWAVALPVLAEGSYRLIATVADDADNRGGDARDFVVGHRSPPTLTVSRPTDGGVYRSLADAVGTATDTSGTGLDRIEVRLERLIDGVPHFLDWGLRSWSAGEPGDAETAIADGTSSWRQALPTLPDGDYTLELRVLDRLGDQGPLFWLGIDFRIDATAPATAFTAPSPGTSFAPGTAPRLGGVTRDASPTATWLALARGDRWLPRWWDWRVRRWTRVPWAPGVWLPQGPVPQWSADAPPLGVGIYAAFAASRDAAGNRALATTTFAVAPNAAQ